VVVTRRDLGATLVAAIVVLVYVANVQGWWYLGSNRWAAVTMLAVGGVACAVGSRVEGKPTAPVILLSLLGFASLVLGVVAIVAAAQWALLALTTVLVALWLGATIRHVATPMRSAQAH